MKIWKRGDVNPETNMVFDYQKTNGRIVWYSQKAWNDKKNRQSLINTSVEGKEYNKKWYLKNKNKHDEINKIARKIRIEEFPLQILYCAVKRNAKTRKIKFEIDFDYVMNLWSTQNGFCFYTKVPMKYITQKKDPFQVSIDRIDSSIGYVKNNVVLCCQAINYMKNDYTITEFNIFLEELALNLIKPCTKI